MAAQPASLSLSRKILRVAIALNWLMAVGIIVMLIVSLVAPRLFQDAMGFRAGVDNGKLIMGMRMMMVLGILSVPVMNIVLTKLLAIVDTVRDGDPFITTNAHRLQTIAWAVVALEVLHLAIGLVVKLASTEAAPLDVNWSFSITRWVVMLMLFVLARVFEQGARMREELEATI